MLNCFTLMCFFTAVVYSSVQDGLVSTPWGKIRGVPETSSSGLSFTSFEGIPYAKPPLGNLRFSKPIPSTGSHQNVLMADVVKPACLVANGSRESEDCLYLDLFVPHSGSTISSPLPVMIYIHGGGFIFNQGDLKVHPLLMRNVIVALVHYRLGAMGFLSTGDEELKGNYGLWDQRMAIQWVKENVAAFGGDPNSVTIFGESAGSASVAYQILAPKSNDLFQRAILQSGAATSSWAFSRQPAQHAHDLGRRLGCASGSSSADLAKCLRKIDGTRLQKEMFALWTSTPAFEHIGDFMFVPVVDHEFVLDEPMKLIKNVTHLQSVGAFDKDVIVGVLNNEGTLVTKSADQSMPNAPTFGGYFARDIIPYMLRQRYGVSTPLAEGAVDSFYRHNMPPTLINKYLVSNAFADVQFVIPALEFVEALSKSRVSSGQQYFYYFDYCPSFKPKVCMGHGTDVAFVFSFTIVKFAPVDQRVSDVFVSLLTTFAKTGTPTSANSPKWPPYSSESKSYLRISTQPEVRQNLFPNRTEFWTRTMNSLTSMPIVPLPIIG